jgi:hypothetical protein
MTYTKNQVLDIINSISNQGIDIDAEIVFEKWNIYDSNKLLNLEKYKYQSFVYSFPFLMDGKEIGYENRSKYIEKLILEDFEKKGKKIEKKF